MLPRAMTMTMHQNNNNNNNNNIYFFKKLVTINIFSIGITIQGHTVHFKALNTVLWKCQNFPSYPFLSLHMCKVSSVSIICV